MKLHVLYILVFAACNNATETKINNTYDQISYTKALDECIKEGKDAGSFSVYDDCAKLADIKYGRKDGIK